MKSRPRYFPRQQGTDSTSRTQRQRARHKRQDDYMTDGLMSPDDRLAAATWGALHHLTDSRTGQRKPNTRDHVPTFAGRLQNLRNHGITAHRGRKDYDSLPKPPEPQSEAETLKNQEIEEFLRHEMNTHLIPNTILFVPGDATQPPNRTE